MGTKASVLKKRSPCSDSNGIKPVKHIRGDLTKKYESQEERQQKMVDLQQKLMVKAEELSDRILEEKDRLSLYSKSRGTSHTTSRTASPSAPRKHVHFQVKARETDIQEANGEITNVEPLFNEHSQQPDTLDS